MASSVSSSDHRLPMSKRRLKPLVLRDYLLDDLSSCSSNGFKSFPRRQSSTVRRLLDAEIKRSGIFHHTCRPTCGLAFSRAVQKASTALLSAVKLLPFPSSSVKSPSPSRKKGLFSRSFSINLRKKLCHRELSNVDDGDIERKAEHHEQKIQRGRSFGDFLKESLDQSSDLTSQVSPPTDSTFSGDVTFATLSDSNAAGGDSSSFGSEVFTNSEVTRSSGESETSNENDAVEDEETRNRVVVMMSGECVGSHVSDGSSVNDNREECLNEEKEQFSPISILECPFEDDANTLHSHQEETDEKKVSRNSRRFESLVIRLEPVDLEKRIEKYVEGQDYDSRHMAETEEDRSENRANRLFALVKSRFFEEPSHLLTSQTVDNLLLDFFKEDGNSETRDEDKLVKIVEEWVMRRQEEEYMLMSWEVSEKREIYVKEMKWGCINGDDQIESVVEELGNCLVTSMIDELTLDLSSSE